VQNAVRGAVLAVVAACGGGGSAPDAACQPGIVYLNRTGGDYMHGARDSASTNTSVLVDVPRTLPPWPHDDIDWRSLTGCITTALAPFPLEITETAPGLAPHVEIVFTTAYWGQPAGTGMLVPDACRPGQQVEFVFGSAIPTYARACHLAMLGFAQMTAQLSPNDNCEDLVNDAADCSATRRFVDQTSACVDAASQPTACRCGGTTENTFAAIAAAFPRCP
jgi:hypothetical protein